MAVAVPSLAIVGIMGDGTVAFQEPVAQEQLKALIDDAYQAPAQCFELKRTDGPDGRGLRVVFIYQDVRYTLDHDWWADGIQVWARPDGTNQAGYSADHARDEDMDGQAEHRHSKQENLYATALAGLQVALASGQ